jgi:hypothetical protein
VWYKKPIEQLRCVYNNVLTCVDLKNDDLLMAKGQVWRRVLQHRANIVSGTWMV